MFGRLLLTHILRGEVGPMLLLSDPSPLITLFAMEYQADVTIALTLLIPILVTFLFWGLQKVRGHFAGVSSLRVRPGK